VNEALAYATAIEKFFKQPAAEIKEKEIAKLLPPFTVFQEAERMTPIAREWLNDYKKGLQLQKYKDTASLNRAYQFFSRSAKSFPDSYLAGACHQFRAEILKRLDRQEEASIENTRAREFYVRFDQ